MSIGISIGGNFGIGAALEKCLFVCVSKFVTRISITIFFPVYTMIRERIWKTVQLDIKYNHNRSI